MYVLLFHLLLMCVHRLQRASGLFRLLSSLLQTYVYVLVFQLLLLLYIHIHYNFFLCCLPLLLWLLWLQSNLQKCVLLFRLLLLCVRKLRHASGLFHLLSILLQTYVYVLVFQLLLLLYIHIHYNFFLCYLLLLRWLLLLQSNHQKCVLLFHLLLLYVHMLKHTSGMFHLLSKLLQTYVYVLVFQLLLLLYIHIHYNFFLCHLLLLRWLLLLQSNHQKCVLLFHLLLLYVHILKHASGLFHLLSSLLQTYVYVLIFQLPLLLYIHIHYNFFLCCLPLLLWLLWLQSNHQNCGLPYRLLLLYVRKLPHASGLSHCLSSLLKNYVRVCPNLSDILQLQKRALLIQKLKAICVFSSFFHISCYEFLFSTA